MLLSSLTGPEVVASEAISGIEVTGITADSRAVQPGFLFAALPGTKVDGARFIADAVARGAVAVLVDARAVVPSVAVPMLRAVEARQALALIASRFYAVQPKVSVAVTGTNGKTSVAEFTRQIFATLGRTAASLGTIGLIKPDGAVYGSLTTPDPVSLHKTLAELAREGVTHVALEASSHGLEQHRVDGVRLAAAAFTNLGRDHLDYHPSEDAYFAAKMRLFSERLAAGQTAVINADGARAEDASAVARARGLRVLTTGRQGRDIELRSLARDGFAQHIVIRHAGRDFDLRFPLLGAYQVENALVAAGLAIAAGEDAASAIEAIGHLSGVKGRLDIVGERAGGLAVVDYAHKPEALAAALDALRPFVSGRLICVFGCGGDRDKGKRPIMGRIASQKADVVIVTDDNPRSEKPEVIRAEILAASHSAREIGDRAEAIRAGVAMLGKGDVLLVAGKGHETGQIVGDTVLPFSDHEAVLAALEGGGTHG
ncbi:MAG TPA: UDP-N-acetylmuramoyl-L-alanyl-D-glutamate--2,6-diaminopimelate ligase [Hyphomicrobiaceae bacterium]|nr:UDP-N-acetylmuramoyl-L-alanyl-D-glutamate--2,6-diaminopimelate ligase [Hyphomicrobiaceae bacterium]